MAFDRNSFLQSVALLRTLTAPEATKAGIITFGDMFSWARYRSNPLKWLSEAPPQRVDAVCRWLEGKHPATSSHRIMVRPGIEKVFTP